MVTRSLRAGDPLADSIDMAVAVSTLVDQVEDAISGLLTALTAANVLEYQMPDGRRIKRHEFQTTLDSLMKARTTLRIQLAAQTRSPIRVGKLGRPRTTDRN